MSSLQMVTRVMQTIDFLSSRGSARLDDVAELLDVHKSNALRLLATLREQEWVVVNDAHTHYSLGPRLIAIGKAAQPAHLPKALSLAEDLRDLTGESVHISMRADDHMLIVGRMDSPHPLKVAVDVGTRDPLHATAVGKVHLATLADDRLGAELGELALIGYTSNTVTDRVALMKEIKRVRKRRYALNAEEGRPGCNAIAVALGFGDDSQFLCLSASGPSHRFTIAAINKLVPDIMQIVEPYNALP